MPDFTKKLFILLIKLFNNSVYTGDKEEIIISEKLSKFIENKDFIAAVEDNYNKENFLKETDPTKDKIIIDEYTKIKKELIALSVAGLECCKNDDIIKDYLKEWNGNFEKYMKDLDEVYYIKIGKEKEHQIKKKFDKLIEKLKAKKSKISIDFVKGLLDDMIEHINNITVFTEDNYAIAEIDVNNVLKDSEGYIDTSSKTTFIHFPIVKYDNDIKPRGDFQKIYSLLMDYSDTKNLLNDLKNYEDKRTCMNLGKIKKYLKIQEDSTFEGIKIQYNILYDKIMGHSDKLETFINDFENSVLSNLILNIYYINKKYLNKNILIEKLNKYCNRNTINESEIEIDLEWASFLSKTREPFDEIILPMYSPKSIIKLFALKNGKGEDDGGMFCISF